jgi:hypothetical protein
MYINPFTAGVIATIIAEMIIFIGIIIILGFKKK